MTLAKKQRKFTEADLGGPIEDEVTARKKLEDAGFDPVKVTQIKLVNNPDGLENTWYVSPIIHFAGAGDLKMCRYLVTRGASATDEAGVEINIVKCPMSAAAVFGRKDVCQWLFHHGAHIHISRERSNPLRLALEPMKQVHLETATETVKWLLFNDGIPSDAEGYLNGSAMKKVFTMDRIERYSVDEAQNGRERLLHWAEKICSVHDAFYIFLCATIHVPRLDSAQGPE